MIEVLAAMEALNSAIERRTAEIDRIRVQIEALSEQWLQCTDPALEAKLQQRIALLQQQYDRLEEARTQLEGSLADMAAAAAQPQPGPTPQAELLTAKGVMLTAVPPIAVRGSPRRSNSKTKGAQRRTYSELRSWPKFKEAMDALLDSLDDTTRRYRGIILPGPALSTKFNAAADESEVRGPMSLVSLIPNAVAEDMGLSMELVGGGSNRSASCIDWVVRKRAAEMQLALGSTPPRHERLDVQVCSDRIFGGLEIKGDWQWDLQEGEDPAMLPPERKVALEPAFQQLFGDMVMDEVPVGMISRHNVCTLVQRPRDVRDKALIVSPAIGLGQMLLACLLLLKLAHERQDWKPDLSRDLVPPTPTEGMDAGRSDSSPHQGHDPGSGQAAPGAAAGEADGGQPPAKRHKADAPGAQGKSGPGPGPACARAELVVVDAGSSGSNGSRANHGAPDTQGAFASPACHSHTQLPLYSFASVGFTGRVIGATRYGKVLQGAVGGVPAAIKVFDPRFRGAAEAMHHEWRVYEHLGSKGAQGACAPRLLLAGELYHTGALFLALSDEGRPLLDQGVLGAAEREELRKAVRGLHAAGVLHGDLRRANCVCSEGGVVKLVDFEASSILPLEGEDLGMVVALKDAEMAAVDAL